MSGFLLIVSSILNAAACPAANAVKLGDACPRDLQIKKKKIKTVKFDMIIFSNHYVFFLLSTRWEKREGGTKVLLSKKIMQSTTYKEPINTAKNTVMTCPPVYPFSNIIFPPNHMANA
ncbi:hypothetical protein L6164_013783 [Bauhinia variegata]|uniref:Uncharacterized protein n=1 Tax=Bauhinia variegata TaxID=167791 RepID=A0ACB9NH93_BAUVA|nr:hypothetical protein L6164_013783 [Bauhinia variegata]